MAGAIFFQSPFENEDAELSLHFNQQTRRAWRPTRRLGLFWKQFEPQKSIESLAIEEIIDAIARVLFPGNVEAHGFFAEMLARAEEVFNNNGRAETAQECRAIKHEGLFYKIGIIIFCAEDAEKNSGHVRSDIPVVLQINRALISPEAYDELAGKGLSFLELTHVCQLEADKNKRKMMLYWHLEPGRAVVASKKIHDILREEGIDEPAGCDAQDIVRLIGSSRYPDGLDILCPMAAAERAFRGNESRDSLCAVRIYKRNRRYEKASLQFFRTRSKMVPGQETANMITLRLSFSRSSKLEYEQGENDGWRCQISIRTE